MFDASPSVEPDAISTVVAKIVRENVNMINTVDYWLPGWKHQVARSALKSCFIQPPCPDRGLGIINTAILSLRESCCVAICKLTSWYRERYNKVSGSYKVEKLLS
jgi:hypothetical protein